MADSSMHANRVIDEDVNASRTAAATAVLHSTPYDAVHDVAADRELLHWVRHGFTQLQQPLPMLAGRDSIKHPSSQSSHPANRESRLDRANRLVGSVACSLLTADRGPITVHRLLSATRNKTVHQLSIDSPIRWLRRASGRVTVSRDPDS